MAPPLSTPHKISTIIPRPLPLYPPSGINSPPNAVARSVVGTPSLSIAQPAGIVVWPAIRALNILPMATVVVAISSSHGRDFSPGTDMQIGLVPTRPSLPCHGGTLGEALHITMPIMPRAEMRSAQ